MWCYVLDAESIDSQDHKPHQPHSSVNQADRSSLIPRNHMHLSSVQSSRFNSCGMTIHRVIMSRGVCSDLASLTCLHMNA